METPSGNDGDNNTVPSTDTGDTNTGSDTPSIPSDTTNNPIIDGASDNNDP